MTTFKRLLRDAMTNYIREMKDGCCECLDLGRLCSEHHREVCDLITSPRKHKGFQDYFAPIHKHWEAQLEKAIRCGSTRA